MSEEKKKYVFLGVECFIGDRKYEHGDVAEFNEEEFEHACVGRAAFEPIEEPQTLKINI